MPRFTICDVLWLTVVIGLSLALATGYLAHRRRLAAWEEERFGWAVLVWRLGSERAKASGKEVVIKAPGEWIVQSFDATGKGTLEPGPAWRFGDAKTSVEILQRKMDALKRP